jgi:hypothetical protein
MLAVFAVTCAACVGRCVHFDVVCIIPSEITVPTAALVFPVLLLLLLQTAPAQLCFIGFLPNILDSKAAGRNAYIDALKGLANDYKDRCGM